MDDADLLRRWAEGDKPAGRELFERHFDALSRFFRTKLPDQAQDLVQSTFVALLNKAGSYRGEGSFRAYLFGIARFELLHELRRLPKGKKLVTAETSIEGLLPSPTSVVARSEDARRLAAVLRSLPLDQQIALELNYWEGMSAVDIGEVLELPTGTVKSRLRLARQSLKRKLSRSSGVDWDDGGLQTWVRAMRAEIEVGD